MRRLGSVRYDCSLKGMITIVLLSLTVFPNRALVS